jgi:hypothetical protein
MISLMWGKYPIQMKFVRINELEPSFLGWVNWKSQFSETEKQNNDIWKYEKLILDKSSYN